MAQSSKRGSVQSGFSEFSFEHNDDALRISTPRSERPQSPTPTTSPLKFDGLIKENKDLKLKVLEQQQLIENLRREIQELRGSTNKGNNINIIEEQKPISLSSSLSASPIDKNQDNSSNIIAQHILVSNQSLSSLAPPPRSANRLKTSPLRDDLESQRTPIITEPEPEKDEKTTLDEEDENDDTTQREETGDNTLTNIDEDLLQTPDNTNVEDDSSRRSSAYSAPPDTKLESPEKTALAPNSYSSPYKGRISSSSSPLRNPPTSASNNPSNSPSPSPISPETTQLSQPLSVVTTTTTDDKSIHNKLNFNESRSTFQGSPLPPKNFSSSDSPFMTPELSIPPSPLEGRFTPAESIKSNLYDPYEGDFQHQQIHQNHNGFGGVYNGENENHELNQLDSTHKRFPSDVPLFVNPTELSTVKTEIITTICGNFSKKSDDPIVIIAVCDRQTGVEMWRFKKSLSSIVLLDTQIRPLINTFSLPPVPEKSLFLSNIPVKVDIRRLRLRDYFSTLFTIPHIPLDAAYKISRFMSQDVVNLLDESNTEALKDGFLLRRSKGLGNNWKARFCEVDGPFLNVYENKDGSLLEILKLTGSQIGRQPDHIKHTDDKSSYRHAFAIMEPKKNLKSSSFTKHIFCAETDQERDLWVNTLIQFVEDPSSSISTYSGDSSNLSSQTIINPEPQLIPSPNSISTQSPSKSSIHTKNDDTDELEELVKESKRNKKRSFFPFSKKNINEELEVFKNQQQGGTEQSSDQETSPKKSNIEESLKNMNLLDTKINEKIFNNEISIAINLSNHELYGYKVPSIIYRCLKFLDDSDAVIQEGLFRLNGSASMIKQLRENFDSKYDFELDEFELKPDINTIAGLLKLYLRELPSVILTKELYSNFRDSYNKIKDPQLLSIEFKKLTQKLPIENYSLIFVLFKFLNKVIQYQEMNKMNLRNLCIVFSPTLNISSEVIIPFFVDFGCIFENQEPIPNNQREVLDIHIPTF
ncbi:GTPase-activating protein [Wickerhamomyces ciferrii]|uniref:GTPase-activating protein n=1 Tax=Wickerhamomyces ciferrii (strain ATCC 14091 / BCRC 22168 / CBS 111 / JCM 3599 / NBRC 0793 / NRRL Y-1031 F-60-10) TaxID=1206466 RepID=K0KIA2_WICCF|nr:GTPase-activating protein [Wickerhamomyces ciferrii]CCH41129.1 GTPase-activating protein [Wickerhamomyces ciferrii]